LRWWWSDSDEAEIAFGPRVKGGILKASKGKKTQPEPESDEAEDDQSGEDTEEDEEGASGSEEEDEIAFGEEMEALPILSTKLSGKRRRDSRKEDTDERTATSEEGYVRTIDHVLCPSRNLPLLLRKKSGPQGRVANGGPVKQARASLDDTDSYDFSQYF